MKMPERPSLVRLEECRESVRQWLGSIALRWVARSAPRSHVLGLVVVDLTLDESGARAMAEVVDVVSLINRVQPRVIAGLARRAPQIAVVRGYPWAGQYWHHLRTLAVEASVVERQLPEAVAMTIVHEAAHARISALGIPYMRHRRRIEERCVNEEIAFAARLPGTERLIEGARKKLASP